MHLQVTTPTIQITTSAGAEHRHLNIVNEIPTHSPEKTAVKNCFLLSLYLHYQVKPKAIDLCSLHRPKNCSPLNEQSRSFSLPKLQAKSYSLARPDLRSRRSSSHRNQAPLFIDVLILLLGCASDAEAKQQDQGFSIRGMANTDGASDGFVKELFPNRVPANSGKELFAEKLQGRGGRRNRAVDVFY